MKKILFAIALAAVAFACNKSEEAGTTAAGEGTLAVRLATTTELSNTTDEGKTTVAAPTNELFNLSITDLATVTTVYEGSLADYDTATLMPQGEKSLRVWYGEMTDEGYDKPYFNGTATASVQGYGLAAEATIEVSVANAAVAIETTELFDSYFQSATFTVVTANCAEGHAYGAEGLLFVEPREVTIKCVAVGPTGTEYTLEQKTPALQAQKRNIVCFDMRQAGNVVVNIEFNNEIIASEVIEVELNDKA